MKNKILLAFAFLLPVIAHADDAKDKAVIIESIASLRHMQEKGFNRFDLAKVFIRLSKLAKSRTVRDKCMHHYMTGKTFSYKDGKFMDQTISNEGYSHEAHLDSFQIVEVINSLFEKKPVDIRLTMYSIGETAKFTINESEDRHNRLTVEIPLVDLEYDKDIFFSFPQNFNIRPPV